MSDTASLPPGSIPVALGEVLAGKYRVDRVLGVGGMGVVVQATHLQLDQRVALKFMLATSLKNGQLVERFTREARAAVRLRSDHVARVLDVGTFESGSPYMVMEYLEGQDLGSVLEHQGPLPVDAAADCLLQACDAVAEAHSLGIVHRDLKPKNLFLTYRNDGRPLVKVLDFGISKQRATSDLSLTRTTEIIGSPNYMSPEQFRAARAADERSDIWALGVILYELLTGALPFPADSVTQLTAMVLSEPPRPIQSLRNSVPDDLVHVVERCMRKDPAARFQNVAQLALALQRFAPPDARDLAARIARIGTQGPRGSQSDAGGGIRSAGAVNVTPSTWAGAQTRPPGRGSTATAVAVIAGVGLLAAAVGARVALTHLPVTAPAAEAAKTAPPLPSGATTTESIAQRRDTAASPAPTLARVAEPVPPLAASHAPSAEAPANDVPPLAASAASANHAAQPTGGPAQPTAGPAQPTAGPAQPTAGPAQPRQTAASAPHPATHATSARPDGGAASPEDGPRYRTNW